jgi:hypothetical protein
MKELVNLKDPQLYVITFIGSHRLGFYKDCRKSEARLRKSLEPFGIPLVTYNLGDLLSLIPNLSSNRIYFFTRYGVGAWFWKPILIRHALTTLKSEYLIYVDSDCAFNINPTKVIEKTLFDSDLAFFAQNHKLKGWISTRAYRFLEMDLLELEKADLVTAGIAIVRNSEKSKQSLQAWELAMRNPRVLLHPLRDKFGIRHRHDQSILSALIARGRVECSLVRQGFFSQGLESISPSLEDSWIYTGDIQSKENHIRFSNKIPLYWDHYSRKFYEVFKTFLVFPLHMMFFYLENFISRDFRK